MIRRCVVIVVLKFKNFLYVSVAKDAAFYHFYQSYEGNSRSKTSNQLSPKETAGPPKETAVPDRNCRAPKGANFQ